MLTIKTLESHYQNHQCHLAQSPPCLTHTPYLWHLPTISSMGYMNVVVEAANAEAAVAAAEAAAAEAAEAAFAAAVLERKAIMEWSEKVGYQGAPCPGNPAGSNHSWVPPFTVGQPTDDWIETDWMKLNELLELHQWTPESDWSPFRTIDSPNVSSRISHSNIQPKNGGNKKVIKKNVRKNRFQCEWVPQVESLHRWLPHLFLRLRTTVLNPCSQRESESAPSGSLVQYDHSASIWWYC